MNKEEEKEKKIEKEEIKEGTINLSNGNFILTLYIMID